VIPFDRYLSEDNETVICDFEIDSVTYKLVINKKASNELKFFADKTEVNCHLQELESSLLSSYNGSNNNNIPLSKMELMGSTSNIDYKIGFHSIGVHQKKSGFETVSLNGFVLVRLKK
jgi:hypothetical protein